MINAKKLHELAKEQMKKIYGIYHPLHHEDAVSHYKSGYRQAEADAAELERCLEFYAHGGNFNTDLWKHDELGYFTGKYAKETLAKWRERGV